MKTEPHFPLKDINLSTIQKMAYIYVKCNKPEILKLHINTISSLIALANAHVENKLDPNIQSINLIDYIIL